MSDAKATRIVVGLGELLWDCFDDSRRPGGAPANVAFQARQLGCDGVVCSRVGKDAPGDELVEFLARQGLDTQHVQRDAEHPTGTVTVDTSRADHPQYTIHQQVAWDYIQYDATLAALMESAAAVCFGSLAQRGEVSRGSIQKALAHTADDCLVVCDVNIRQDWYTRETLDESLRASRLVKLNDAEVPLLAKVLGLDCKGEVEFCRAMQERYEVDAVCVTQAERGCLLVDGDKVVDSPGVAIELVDAVGAGDAFTAAWITARLAGRAAEQQAALANRVGAMVASRAGAMPELKREFGEILGSL